VRRYLPLIWLLVAAACKDSSNEITHSLSRQLGILCAPAGPRVACRAFLSDPRGMSREVTLEAAWSVSGPVVGTFTEPGLFLPSGSADVGLRARFEELTSDRSWFFVNPPQDARPLTFMNGVVRDEMTNAGLEGVEVRILDGHSAGERATTNSVGVYSFGFSQILTGETFTVSASKPGYESSTKTHRVDFPFDPANPPFLDFVLRRLAA
jgi:hypothetical protein